MPSKSAKPPRLPDSAFRLSGEARPTHYQVHVVPDLAAGTFRGDVAIDLQLKPNASGVELHAADLTIDHAELVVLREGTHPRPEEGVASGPEPAAAIVPHPPRETIEIKFLRPITTGRAVLRLAYRGNLQTRLRGLYAASSGERRYAFTQLEACDARRFFPCFDEPSYKARYTFSVTVEPRSTAISNNPIERIESQPPGSKTVHFKTTPPLSSYLCALGVGELEGSPTRHVGPTPVRVWYVPGKGHLADFALEAAVESLSRLERYFGIPYPYEKLDLLAVPDFEAGAMENAGAVFFRETLLLVDPATITIGEKKRVAEVIAHELAHMWFGDLVTMRWWDDLWLNESFATWMAFRIIDEWKPEWRMWNNFEHHRAAAMALDALANTHPIYAEVKNAAQATENFDAITYEKGASVVRMIEHYLGAQKFRAGVRAYIRKHRESNAVAADLWQALEKASGHPVAELARAWIKQPGFPLLTFTAEPAAQGAKGAGPARARRGAKAAGLALIVKQERFLTSPITKPAEGKRGSWPVPLVLKLGRTAPRSEAVSQDGAGRRDGKAHRGVRVERHLLRHVRERIATRAVAGKTWYYGNASEGGFYRVLHDAEDFAALTGDLAGTLEIVERMGMIGHQWAAVRAGRAGIASFLELASALASEENFDVLDTLSGPLSFVEDQLVEAASPESHAHFQAWLASLFVPAWRDLGWASANANGSGGPGSDERKLRRASVLRIVGLLAELRSLVNEAASHFAGYVQDRTTLEPNLVDPLITMVAREGDLDRFAEFRRLVGEARTPQERRRFQLALGDFRDPGAVTQALQISLTPEVATQDVGFLLMRMFANRAARETTWRFVRDNWEALAKRLPPMMAARLIESTSALGTREHRKEVAIFFRAHPVETGTRALKLALERFEVNEEFRRRARGELRGWLAARAAGSPSPNLEAHPS
ncbi:MAG TPA: M1 family aminopeptidase [Candidatus Bathyarchaeia archaeon]|nr:M1 family aminopeptidase [Candidatus Bathyarchaeia archaeon]